MSKFKKCIPSAKHDDGTPDLSGNIKTPGCRMMYPALFEPVLPKGETDDSKKKYQIMLFVPADADISLLKEAVRQCRDDNFSAAVQKNSKIKMPFIKTEDEPRFAELADEYPIIIRASANPGYAPGVVGPSALDVKAENAPDEVYSGRWGRASVRPFAWNHATGGPGVSLGLQNVQLLEHDEPMAGGKPRASDEFDATDVGDDDGEVADDMDDLVG